MRNPSRFAKIQRERERQARKEERAKRKAERREAKQNTTAVDGEDPDLAGIVAGPQPLPPTDD